MSGIPSVTDELQRLRIMLEAVNWMACQPHVYRDKALRMECQQRMARLADKIKRLGALKQA